MLPQVPIMYINNLFNVGLSSLNIKFQVPSDLPVHGQFIDSSNLKSQYYLNELNEWSKGNIQKKKWPNFGL